MFGVHWSTGRSFENVKKAGSTGFSTNIRLGGIQFFVNLTIRLDFPDANSKMYYVTWCHHQGLANDGESGK